MSKGKSQQEQLRAARKALGATTAELAAKLGTSKAAVTAWLAPKDAAKHRTMPATAKMLLERIVKEHRSK